MDQQTVELLCEVAKNAEMGRDTVHRLLGIAQDERLKVHLHRQLATYEDLAKRAHAMLAVEGKTAPPRGTLSKMGAQMGVTMQTMRDRSARNLAEMLIEGSHVGVTDMTKALKDCPGANPGAVALAQRLQHAENQYAGELNVFL